MVNIRVRRQSVPPLMNLEFLETDFYKYNNSFNIVLSVNIALTVSFELVHILVKKSIARNRFFCKFTNLYIFVSFPKIATFSKLTHSLNLACF